MMPSEFHFLISELSFGTDTRRIRLPLDVDLESAETRLYDGVLCVKFQKLESHAPKRLKIM
jgi:HSP20 family molecular chaperone IbpA